MENRLSTISEVSKILNLTKPGDHILMGFEKDGKIKDYVLNLSEWPKEMDNPNSGFMGISYYRPDVVSVVQHLYSPIGILFLLSVPFNPYC